MAGNGTDGRGSARSGQAVPGGAEHGKAVRGVACRGQDWLGMARVFLMTYIMGYQETKFGRDRDRPGPARRG